MRVPGNTTQAKQHAARLLPAIVAGVLLTAAAADVHSQTRCVFLCAPELKIEPTLTIENTFGPARLEQVEDGIVLGTKRQEREKVLELVLAIGIPTEIPRVGFTVETIFSPFRDDTEVELELELNLTWLEPEQTGGWVESHFDIIDKFSPAERPTDTSAYTHKLNFELDTAVLIFNWLDEGNWLRHLEVEGSLDYVATGLPRAGDVIGNERFLDDASPWSFSLVFIAPLAPLFP
ncbi:MAG: hypothetical protein V3T48_11605 [Vicinamibacterales bacterium]